MEKRERKKIIDRLWIPLLFVVSAALLGAMVLPVFSSGKRSAVLADTAAEIRKEEPESTPYILMRADDSEKTGSPSENGSRTDKGRLEPGFRLENGCLFYVDEKGYFLRNGWVGSLYFGEDGIYTSGNAELDQYVRAAVAEQTAEGMTREECLRVMYGYVRDHFSYLTRNYHLIGAVGIAAEEALTMYATGKGNCYNYAAAFWAAARALGYDARFVTGTVDVGHSPHGWVEIYQDEERRTYDVELEMSQHREEKTDTDLFAVSDADRASWMYIESSATDQAVPRENNDSVRIPFPPLPEDILEGRERFLAALQAMGSREPMFALTPEQESFLLQDETLWDYSVRRNNYARSPYRYRVNYEHTLKSMFENLAPGAPEWVALNNLVVVDCFSADFGNGTCFTCVTAANYNYQTVRLILPGTSCQARPGEMMQAYAMPIGMGEYINSAGRPVTCLIALGADGSL